MNATTHVVRRRNDGKYFKVVTHPFLMTELNSANPNDLKGEERTMPSGDLSVLLINGYKLVNDVNRISSSNSSRSRSRGRSNSYRSRGTGSTKSISTMSTMSSRTSKGGKRSRNVKSKNKTYKKRRNY
jgi:hypothetical protein